MKYSHIDNNGVYLEDKLLKFLNKNNGFFIELGTNNGLTQSNTAALEFNKNWTGVLIEPSKNAYEQCIKNRPNSKCFNYACVSNEYTEEYIQGDFDGGLMNSINGERCKSNDLVPVKTITLEKILNQVNSETIDFLSLDVEGYELEVLKGLNLQKYRPNFMLIKIYKHQYENIRNFLIENNYSLLQNFTSYDNIGNPNWDGTHNDYLFINNDIATHSNIETYNFNQYLYENLLFITLTNTGYIEYTENMLKSLENVNLDRKILLFCMDENSYKYFTNKNYNTFLINTNLSELLLWGTNDFRKCNLLKFLIIYKLLSRGYDIVFTDGDIVYNKNCIPNLIEEVKDYDIAMQDEYSSSNDDFCTGFFIVKSNDKTIKAFNVEKINFYQLNMCDQMFFNRIVRPQLLCKKLPIELYPNGNYFYSNSGIKNDANIIHFNYRQGNQKKDTMKEYDLWYL